MITRLEHEFDLALVFLPHFDLSFQFEFRLANDILVLLNDLEITVLLED